MHLSQIHSFLVRLRTLVNGHFYSTATEFLKRRNINCEEGEWTFTCCMVGQNISY